MKWRTKPELNTAETGGRRIGMMPHARKFALKDMSFVEFRERMSEDPVILLPLGSQEIQGPHAPMGDYQLAERLAIRAAEAADAIAAPIMPFGYADVFRAVPGGIQLRPETFCHVLEDMATAFLDHGLRRLVIFNGHTGNTALIDQTVRRLRRERDVVIPSINIWKIIPPELWRRLHGANAAAAQGHGADPITSVYLHMLPQLMRMDLIKDAPRQDVLGLTPAGLAAVTFDGAQVLLPINVTEVNAAGMIGGDPRHSTAEIGAAISDHVIEFTARFIRHFRRCDPDSLAGPLENV
jgi:creatinine amidohydrolase